MSTKFFTNDAENTLLNKLKGVFTHNQIAHFDALVGYFQSAGYFHIHPYLKSVDTIRILVGIEVDKLTAAMQQQGLQRLATGNEEAVRTNYRERVETEINDADYTEDIEQSMRQFIDDIVAGKIEIRAHPTRILHAKIYIFRPKDFNEHTSGEVITGSSNLTSPGLGASHRTSNYEFNVALRDYDDIKFATDEFEKLWGESIELLPADFENAKNKTFLRKDCTPFELYIKLLIEYFDKEIEFDPNKITDLPPGFKKLTYQLDACEQGFEIIKRHNGVFLADVVGLGKTIIAILIARRYFYFNDFPEHISHTLIVAPPALIDTWKETVDKFKLSNAHFKTTGSLHTLTNHAKYDVVIVDEAHKFRNDTSDAYQALQNLCKTPTTQGKAKKVLLLSATPLNNRPNDIRNQLLLFQDSNNSTLEVNLMRFFDKIAKQYRDLMQVNTTNVQAKTAKLYEQVRNKIIEPLTVRRTRKDLLEIPLYADDLKKQNIRFPKVNTPKPLLYPLEHDLSTLYDTTLQYIAGKDETALCYMRYRAIEFLNQEHKKDYERPEFIAERLAAIMRTLLVKRMDSSFHAFHQTLKRFLRASGTMRKMVERNQIIIAPDHTITEDILEERGDEFLDMLATEQATDPRIKILTKDDFSQRFIDGLNHDHAILKDLVKCWDKFINGDIDPKRDTLFEALESELLNPNTNPEQKLVIFSESLDTTTYLEAQLNGKGYTKILAVNSSTRKKLNNTINANFDANLPTKQQRSDYNIIITTEVLAEGVNLHRANTVLNYDTPWNATRLMQRIGRLNRIGTTATDIYIYNFLPTEKIEGDIGLRHKASVKLHAFHSALGEDSQIYMPDEQIGSFGLFDKNITQDDTLTERLQYLQEIRTFRQQSPDAFKHIKNLPLKIRNGVDKPHLKDGTMSFLRNQHHMAFYKVSPGEDIEELSFTEAAGIFKCDPDAQAIERHKHHHEQVQQALQHFEQQTRETVTEQQANELTAPQTQAIKYLKILQGIPNVGEQEQQTIEHAIESIRQGRFQSLAKDINKLKKRKPLVTPSLQLQALMEIISNYSVRQNPTTPPSLPTDTTHNTHPRIIISQSYS